MRFIAILIVLLSASFGFSKENSNSFRKYNCTSAHMGVEYFADIYFADFKFKTDTVGEVVFWSNSSGEKGVPMLIRGVRMLDEINKNGVPCIFTAKWALQMDEMVSYGIRFDTCNNAATVSVESESKSLEIEALCKDL